ncbi:TPA: thioesterase II family protein [Pseudomonas putida]
MHVQKPPATEDSGQPPRTRLICLACRQEHLEQYRAWSNALSDHIELIAVDVRRHAECSPCDPLHGPSPLARTVAKHLHPYLKGPHALFGQCLGAHLAFELAQLAEREYPGQTRHLFVSSCDSPRVAEPGASANAIRLPVTVLYPLGALPEMLGWHAFVRRELELIELPDHRVDKSYQDQRLVRIFNTHLGLLSF